MSTQLLSDRDFLAMFEKHGAQEMARRTGQKVRGIFGRRERLEKKLNRQINTGATNNFKTRSGIEHSARIPLDIKDGYVLIGSDAHYWPGIVTTAHRAFVKFAQELRPKAIIMNGDVLDGASISRHPPIGWEVSPTLEQEMDACKERLGEILKAAPAAERIWTLGNHDGRFETRIATVAPEYAKVHGVHLKDHFPQWRACWAAWINDAVVVKHRYKGGVHATHNNALASGKTMVTGHLHSLKVTPYDDYNGRRWGIDSGTLAEPGGPQFLDYCEDNPTNWRSGFVVLRFVRGVLCWPQLVSVTGPDEVDYCNQLLAV